MAKKNVSKEEKAKASKERAKKYETAQDTSVVLNEAEVGKTKVTTKATLVRGVGVLVTEVSSTGSVSTVFVPGVKIKTKKAWKYLVEDKGPKPKKEKAEKKAKK